MKNYVLPNMSVDGCVKAMDGVVGPLAIVEASKMSGITAIFLKTK